MKTLLYLLYFLFPISVLAQQGYVSHSYTNAVPEGGFVVGDTLTVKIEIIDNSSNITPDHTMLDFQWNNKLLQFVDITWNTTELPSDVQKNWSNWTGYSFNELTTHEGVAVASSELSIQYEHGWLNRGGSYSDASDWTVGRITLQSASDLPLSTPLAEFRFILKDRQGTNYGDYTNITNLNWAKVEDIAGGSGLYVIHAGTEKISVNNVGGVGAGNITINLNSAAAASHATDFTYKIYQTDANNNETVAASGDFDANGQIITNTLVLGETYNIDIKVDDNATWLNDVMTVTDAYLIFQEALSVGTTPGGQQNAFTKSIQYLLGELNNSGNVTFEDSYIALAHISGVETNSTWYTSTTNGAKNIWGDTGQYGVSTNEYYFGQKKVFTLDGTTTFNFGHGLVGDVDFSHGFEPTADVQTNSSAKNYAPQTMLSRAQNPVTANLDIVSELVNGKVVLTINLAEAGIVGTQFDIRYDNTVLTFESANFDTGNEMTNFSNHNANLSKIFVGSLDGTGESTIKTGAPYKLVFVPNQALQNTAGLVSFFFTEGVKGDGTKVKFNMQ